MTPQVTKTRGGAAKGAQMTSRRRLESGARKEQIMRVTLRPVAT
jgi:hypothetical protein